jgi:chromosomal replication initiation ATPase DnaA
MDEADTREADEAAAYLAVSVASFALAIPQDEIKARPRGSVGVAFARQTAMYLCHVAFEFSLARVASAFGRDRSTVAHACHVIEDRRDDPTFDAWIDGLEGLLREAPARPVRKAFALEARR